MKKTETTQTTVIIMAAGSGTRMGTELPKQFLPVGGIPILVHTVRRIFELLPQAEIVVVVSAAYMLDWSRMARLHDLPTHQVCTGGDTRFESVRRALDTVTDSQTILVHDAVRPIISQALIDEVLRTTIERGTAVPVVEPVDSFRVVAADGSCSPFDRSTLRAVQTPQGFRADILRKAYSVAYQPLFTDDASVVEYSGVAVTLCRGERANIKITTAQDIDIAEALLRKTESYGDGVGI